MTIKRIDDKITVTDHTTPEDAERGDCHILVSGPWFERPEGMSGKEFADRLVSDMTGVPVEEVRQMKPIDFYAQAKETDPE